MNRYQPPLESEFSSDQQRVAAAIAGGLRGDIPGPLLVWLRQPGLADRAQRLGEYCRYQTSLRTDLVEIAILCVARVWGSEFEWHAHKRIALEKGVRPQIIESIRNEQRPQWESREQEIVFDFSYAVLVDRAVGDELFETAVGALGIDTVVDLVGILGYYSMISMTINVFDVPLPDGATPELT